MSDPAAVCAHLDRILASPGFANAERLRRFLQFTVNNPRVDPIVRVEARRRRTTPHRIPQGHFRCE